HEAGVPIWMTYIDYSSKVIGLGPLFETTDDLEADLVALGGFYADKTPRRPENWIVPAESKTYPLR
ncbi:MAG: glycerol acyltransferase, partial [Planctomycetota bacterium]|nr:glycerol acyltransferase [Planctomycetota bacterium]